MVVASNKDYGSQKFALHGVAARSPGGHSVLNTLVGSLERGSYSWARARMLGCIRF